MGGRTAHFSPRFTIILNAKHASCINKALYAKPAHSIKFWEHIVRRTFNRQPFHIQPFSAAGGSATIAASMAPSHSTWVVQNMLYTSSKCFASRIFVEILETFQSSIKRPCVRVDLNKVRAAGVWKRRPHYARPILRRRHSALAFLAANAVGVCAAGDIGR